MPLTAEYLPTARVQNQTRGKLAEMDSFVLKALKMITQLLGIAINTLGSFSPTLSKLMLKSKDR